MYNSTIPNCKYGECTICLDGVEKECRKVGKNLICLHHYKEEKTKQQSAKSRVKQSVRSLGQYQKEQGLEPSLQNLIDDLDTVVSKFIRLKEADKDGFNFCFTSGVKKHWKELQAGHFISRQHLMTRWDENNLRPQTAYDNCYLAGNLKVYAEKLEAEKKGITEWLYEQSKIVWKPSKFELMELLIHWRQRLRIVESKLIKK
jgi:hypothetical protein